MTTSSDSFSRVSLLDLGHQLPFEIDDELKAELTFAETLIVSCAHYEGENYSEDDAGPDVETTMTCTATTSDTNVVQLPPKPFEIKDHVEEPQPVKPPEEDDEFHFFFFPDCKKPLPSEHSKQSLIMIDGMPQLNPKLNKPNYCTCDPGKKGVCECHIILPCKCGAKKRDECICNKVKEICICDENKPNIVCTCQKDPRVCTCFPGLPRPICVCDEVEKPCICKKGFPNPVCQCKYKPKLPPFGKSQEPISLSYGGEWQGEDEDYKVPFFRPAEQSVDTSVTSAAEGEGDGEGGGYDDYNINRLNSAKLTTSDYKKLEDVVEEESCDCQKPEPKEHCLCLKGKKCICKQDTCICGVQKTCVCTRSSEGTEPTCKSDTASTKMICDCPIPRVCKCEAKGLECKCFPRKPYCTCGDPENCKCKNVCDCTEPCICDTQPRKPDECICLDKEKQFKAGLVCSCPCKEKDQNKLKKIRAGKHGYVWCHDVDPYHTFFDYAYGRHDLIDHKEQEKEKFKILGLYDETEKICPVHGFKLPPFEKKVRKPSLDCCSSVGGITISVETLGERQDKFLIQVVSHASKEGAKTGSKLVSIVDSNLHTLEENRTEHITKRNITKQRKSYMAICDNGYYNKVTRICGEKHIPKRHYHTFEQAKKFLLEGANVVLLRYFGLRRYKGVVKTETVLMDGSICESIYVCPGVSQAVVNGKPLFVNKVERHIIEPNGFVHQTLTVLSLRGYVISHEWADNSYVLHINPLLNLIPTEDRIEDHAPLREKWREDLQLFSDFLDFKTTRSHEGARYVAENGMLTDTIRDYLQAILLLKPNDVVHFTRHYFDSALSSMDLPRDEYFDECQKHVRYFYIEE